ncbi:hypothetical protein TURU_042636 [Turdus rufiventris]|nr:hypothetical protein TURU_042636 [Turdus rufiventris]
MAAPSSIVPVMASKTKTKKKHFVAQKVKLFRASDPLLSVLMWGVNHSVLSRNVISVCLMIHFALCDQKDSTAIVDEDVNEACIVDMAFAGK